ncbi:UrvD/REP family ATP-dependent DNA helicase [Ruania rhizosphaerae]|uniref:UrvD/REP family ATP-dependent DNA helicase n=1 Tax=Ruania rhizosphaerae TaxID=1840413 RepID=UPI0013594024|nr:UrvD/REP family ATP-dependent DNA helicase [Ruania rhizosphaerae]
MPSTTALVSRLSGAAEAARHAIRSGGHHAVYGAPGSGKSTTASLTLTDWVTEGRGEAVLLVPTRRRAAQVRDEIASRLQRTSGSVLVRTPASLAFAILRLRASHLGEPPPTLVTGPEQDQILADLLAGHAAGDGAPIDWPASISTETLGLRAFRHELRDLLMRAAEAGLDGDGLAAWGEHYGRPEWRAAGQLLTEYTQVLTLGQTTPDRGARYDAATIVDEAVSALRTWAQTVPEVPRPGWSLVLHDDYQDATLATARLLDTCAEDGAQIAVLGDPDLAVQQFRGGVPALLHTATLPPGQDGAWGAQAHVLDQVWRHPAPIRNAVITLTEPLPVMGETRRRRAPAEDGAAQIKAVLLASEAQQVAYIARHLREKHVHDGVPWSQMAVVVRSGSLVGAVRRGLRTAGVPLAMATADRPLREEPAVRPLLLALRCAITAEVAPQDAAALLTSPLGGLDAVGVRALRRALRHRERSDGGGRLSEDLLSDLFSPAVQPDGCGEAATESADLVSALPERLARGVRSVLRVLTAAAEELAREGATVETVLWEIWDSTGLASAWQRRALAGGSGGDRADTDLDAVMALFRAAEQFVDRSTLASPGKFLEYLAAQDFPADTLAAHGDAGDAVAVHTPAAAAGGEWDVVVVAGVQDDTWPDLRIRDTLLGAAQLADIATERHVATTDRAGRAEVDAFRRARREVYEGELRTFVSACSRARRDLLVTAVLDTDARPSVFVEALLPDDEELPAVTPVAAPLDLRGLVGRLRGELRPVLAAAGGAGDDALSGDVHSDDALGDAGDDRRVRAAAALLSHLAEHHVHGADPGQWPTFRTPSTTSPLWEEGEPVTVSPSTLEDVTTCPLRWALTRHGGRPGDSAAQGLGNLVHEIAAEHPRGSEPELLAALAERWHELDLGDGWVARRERERGEDIMRKLAQYIAERADRPVAAEVEFSVDLDDGGVRLRGRVDRVERTSSGLRIVDLKTGKTPVSKPEAERHPQLGSYQVAVQHGAFAALATETAPGASEPGADEGGADGEGASDGAALVYLGAGTKKVSQREQRPLAEDPEPGWAEETVLSGAAAMAAATFEARPNPRCRICPVRTSCPAQQNGGRLQP